ncbi:MAG: acyltransferase [Brachybacterium sp.]|uniref:acyltransferase family protein n=1 Tax=Brachybacterium sp. TaxID=1891286 RepID=UPI002649FA5F|nr:acyltransferase [Brachybacterium sp.]MDN5687847.1 acyltransferase [Brachybacterium sp.]
MVEQRAVTTVSVSAEKSSPGVFEGLQALRFVAALLVLVTHATFYTSTRLDPDVSTWEAGTAGVDIFFVISGFVMMITASPFMGVSHGWRYFAMRRIVRIVPMYWIATTAKIVALLILPGVALRSSLDPQHVLFSYLFLPSFNDAGAVEPVMGVGWTLTFEMFFYAVFAIALMLRVNPLLFVGSVMVALTIWGQLGPEGSSPWAVYLDPVTLYFVVGMAIAVLVRKEFTRWLVVLSVVCLCAAGALVLLGAMDWSRSAPFRFAVIVGLVAVTVLAEPSLRRVLPKQLLFFGDASYSIYLFHPLFAPMVPVALAILGVPVVWLSVVGAIVWALVVTSAIYALVERRLVRLGRRLPYAGRVPRS